jgi:hypothetical protein
MHFVCVAAGTPTHGHHALLNGGWAAKDTSGTRGRHRETASPPPARRGRGEHAGRSMWVRERSRRALKRVKSRRSGMFVVAGGRMASCAGILYWGDAVTARGRLFLARIYFLDAAKFSVFRTCRASTCRSPVRWPCWQGNPRPRCSSGTVQFALLAALARDKRYLRPWIAMTEVRGSSLYWGGPAPLFFRITVWPLRLTATASVGFRTTFATELQISATWSARY